MTSAARQRQQAAAFFDLRQRRAQHPLAGGVEPHRAGPRRIGAALVDRRVADVGEGPGPDLADEAGRARVAADVRVVLGCVLDAREVGDGPPLAALLLRPEFFDISLDLALEFALPIRLPDADSEAAAGFPLRQLAAERCARPEKLVMLLRLYEIA